MADAKIEPLQETVEHIDEELAWLLARRQRCAARLQHLNVYGVVPDAVRRRALAAAHAEGLDLATARRVWDALGLVG